LAGYAWEFNLIQDDKQQNAWAMPGGKTAVYTGILPITQDENGLAVVMAHEIAHAVAKHGSERMSQGLVQQLGGQALGTALSTNSAVTQQVALQAFGVGSQLGLLRYGRNQESEADRLGLIFMAMAGYNPDSAVGFWQRMAARDNGASPPEFLSTHPSNETRIGDIQRLLPEARKYYQPR
jgi:predicted Zn-dependent protease